MNATMRLATQTSYGGPEVLTVVDGPVPEPLPTEIRVKVLAAGVNPVDAKTRSGRGMAVAVGAPPFTLGWDVAGEVDALGMGVSRFAVGDRVLGMPLFPRRAGTYAQFVTGPARQFVRVPDGVDLAAAAALPLAGTTAWQILVDVANVQAGDEVLILAAGGGVGHLAVQIAKNLGARVTGVDSADKLERLATIGLDLGIDFRETDFRDAVREVDVVVDFLGGDTSFDALKTLKRGGLLVSVPSNQGTGLDEAAAQLGVRAAGIIVEPDREALESVTRLLAAGSLQVWVGEQLPLESVAEAHRLLEAGTTIGKIVLVP